MARKKTHEEYVQDVQYFFGNELTVDSKFTHSEEPIWLKHKCGERYKVSKAYHIFTRGSSCPKCGFEKIDTEEKIKNKLNILYNKEYKLIEIKDEIISDSTLMVVEHSKCKDKLTVTVKDFFHKKKICKKCKRNRLTIDEFKQRVYEAEGVNYTVLSESIVNVDTKIMMRHEECGHEYPVTPNHFKQGKRCPKCATGRFTKKQLSEKLTEASEGQYQFTLPETYDNVQQKVSFLHNKCKKSFDMRVADFLYHKQRCPYCKQSKNELRISKYLDSINIKHKRQYSTDKCKHKIALKFDFLVLLPNGKKGIIEYNGIQHYKPVSYFGGEENFNLIQKRDRIKEEFCKKRNIPMLIIPYTYDDKIEELVQEFLDKHRS